MLQASRYFLCVFVAGKPVNTISYCLSSVLWPGRKERQIMKRDKEGRYTREENVDKKCKVLLENGKEEEMAKGQMYELIKDDKEKKIIFQNGLYFVVHKDVYKAIKQPEW